MNTNKKRVGTKAKIRAIKEKERRIATTISLIFILLVIIVSAYFAHTYLLKTKQTIKPSSLFKAVIVDHLGMSHPNQNFIENTTNMLEKAGYTIDYFSSEKVTVDFYRKLIAKGYGLIILRVHSTTYEKQKNVYYFTSQLYNSKKYTYEQLTDQVGIGLVSTHYYLYTDYYDVQYFTITPNLIQQTQDAILGNTTIIAMGCDGLKYESMARAFIEKGAKTYISWNGPVGAGHTDHATTYLLKHLILEKQTIKQATENTMKAVGSDPSFGSQLIYYPSEAADETIEYTG